MYVFIRSFMIEMNELLKIIYGFLFYNVCYIIIVSSNYIFWRINKKKF